MKVSCTVLKTNGVGDNLVEFNLLSNLTIDEQLGVMLEFEELDPDKFAQLVTDAPQRTEWMA